MALVANHAALARFQVGGDGVGQPLRIVDGKVGQLDGERHFVFRIETRGGLDVGDIGEPDLAFFYGTAVEDFRWNGFRGDVDALLLRLV